jgi:hypothetical protein
MGYAVNELITNGVVLIGDQSDSINIINVNETLFSINKMSGLISVNPTIDSNTPNSLLTKSYFEINNNVTPVTQQAPVFSIPFDTAVENPNTWSASSATLSESKVKVGSSGVQSAALCFGGYTSALALTAVTEKFNGSSWSTASSIGTAAQSYAGCGIQNATVASKGPTYKFNGTIWTLVATGALSNVDAAVSVGTLNNAIIFGGYNSGGLDATYKFNGVIWSAAITYLNTARSYAASSGRVNAALCFGGLIAADTPTEYAERFDGTNWFVAGSMIHARDGLSGCGTTTNSLSFGGAVVSETDSNITEKFNSISWAVSGTMNTDRKYAGGVGDYHTGLVFGGISNGTTYRNTTEMYRSIPCQKIKVSKHLLSNNKLWETLSATLNVARSLVTGSGTQNAMICSGGTGTSTVEKFNGNAWSHTDTLSANRYSMGACGVQNNAIVFAGYTTSDSAYTAVTELFNGLVWSNGYSMDTARSNIGSAGRTNAALAFGGATASATNLCFKYSPSGWAATGNISARHRASGAGRMNAALAMGGYNAGTLNGTQTFNGSTWTNSSNLNSARYDAGGAGTQNNAFVFGGYETVALSSCESFNGSVWTNVAQLSVLRYGLAKGGCSTSANVLAFGGYGATSQTDRYRGATIIDCNMFITNKYDIFLTNETEVEVESGSVVSVEYNLLGYSSTAERSELALLDKIDDNYWVVADTLNTARDSVGTAGVQNATLCFGGYVMANTYLDTAEKYNGSVWSVAADMTTARKGQGYAGVMNAALCMGGYNAATTYLNSTEKFDGSLWYTANGVTLNTARQNGGSAGTVYAAAFFGGASSAVTRTYVTETCNGFAWTASGNLPSDTATVYVSGCGSQSAALCLGGFPEEGTDPSVYLFNGSTWTTLAGTLFESLQQFGSAGTLNNAICFGGWNGSSATRFTEKFDGYTWFLSNILNTTTHVYDITGVGSGSYPMSIGGNNASTTSTDITEKRVHATQITSSNFSVFVTGKNIIAI